MKNVLLILLIFTIASCNMDQKHVVKSKTKNSKIGIESVNHVFKVPEVPNEIFFADEKIDLSDTDLKESFDRELVVNNFWHSNTILYLKRANRWFPLMKSILNENGVPEDLVYLAVIESGLTQATSPSGAKGFWQFMPRTAKDYGMIIDRQVDERMNVSASTQAACEYLKKAYLQFGSWMLAAAAYNRGRKGISDALENQKVSSYFDLSLNSETSRYVFRMLAVKYIMEKPEAFGFIISEDQLYPEYDDRIEVVDYKIKDLSKWAIDKGTSLKVIRKLNPWILRNHLDANKNYTLKLLIPKNSEQLGLYKG